MMQQFSGGRYRLEMYSREVMPGEKVDFVVPVKDSATSVGGRLSQGGGRNCWRLVTPFGPLGNKNGRIERRLQERCGGKSERFMMRTKRELGGRQRKVFNGVAQSQVVMRSRQLIGGLRQTGPFPDYLMHVSGYAPCNGYKYGVETVSC
jgi:hypothetical protein